MEWVQITTAGILSHLPTDVLSHYTTWIAQYPDRANRLAEITANTIREFRDAIKSVPANTWHSDETYLPQSAVRHCENIIVFTLGMEMGMPIDTSGNLAVTNANIYLRQIPMGRLKTVDEGETGQGSPSFTVPSDSAHRSLPAFALAFLLFAARAFGGWIEADRTMTDATVYPTFVPSAYTITASTLYGHLYGINQTLASVGTNKASTVVYNGITNTASGGVIDLGDLPFISNSNCNWRILTSCEDIQYLFGTNVIMRLAYGETDLPDILSLAVETNPPALTITFAAIGTSNLLETTTNQADWATWNDCTWSYTNGTGTVVATEVDLDIHTWARVVSLSGIVTTNPYLHVTAPIYSGAETSAATRVATFGELAELRTTKAAYSDLDAYVPLSRYLMAQGPGSIATNAETGDVTTNYMTPGDLYAVWNFDSDSGTAFFNDAAVSNLTLGGVTRTDWPEGSDGISASTATGIAQIVATSYGFASTGAVQAIAGAAVAASQMAEGTPQALALADGFVTIWSTGLWEQAYTSAAAATVRVVKANASNSAAIIWHATLSNHPTFFVTNNLLGFTTTGLATNGGTSTVSLRSKPGSTNWTWSVDLP